jgi:cytochrome c oxidase subunit 1
MRTALSTDSLRGALAGLAGTGAGIGIAVAVRIAWGLAAWSPGPVLTIGIISGVITYLAATGVFNYWARWAIGRSPAEPSTPPRSWRRYFNVDTNHKVIGIQYIVTALVFLPVAVAYQIVGRLELSKIGVNLEPQTYLSLIGDHGVVMLFIVVLPMWSGVMNYLVPLMIGARDMAFPRLNAFSYWLVPPAGLLIVFALLAGGFDTGWTVYAPLSSEFAPLGMNLILIGVFIGGLSSILGAVNILTTIIKMRAPGMGLFRMPIFVWSSMATVGLSLGFTQFVAISFLMVLLERVLHMGFFLPQMGGQALLYQYLFWFYSHPAVYVFVLPGLGIISEIVPVFARKPIFGYKAVALSSPGIALGGTVVFVHHMFAAGIPDVLRIPFMVTTLLVAVPTGVKLFAWTATMWMGKLILQTPFLFVLSAILVFLVGGLTGVPVGIVPTDLYLHDTYYVVAHFHGTLFGGFLLPLMAALYYWFPKVTGRKMGERLGKAQWALMTVGTLLIILPLFELGFLGMRRRVIDYAPNLGFQPFHIASLVGAVLVFAGLVILAINIIRSARHGERTGGNPWNARTLDWQVSSPPPEENFAVIPEVIAPPYGYGEKEEDARHAIMHPRNADQEADHG